MTTRRWATLLACLILTSLWAMSPASAQSDLAVVFSGPADVADSTITVAGRVEGSDVAKATVTGITVTLVPDNGEPIKAIQPNTKAVPEFEARFKVPRNGRYTANVEAQRLVLQPVKGSRTFVVAVPPARPTDVKVEVSPERAVTVSWARNSEPVLYYLVSRKNEADGKLAPAGGRVAQPESGRVSFVDPFPALAGGDFSYEVVAVAPPAVPGGPPLRSLPGTSDKVSVAAPPATTAAPVAGASGLLGGLPATQPRASAPGPAPRPLVDTGFSESLPFGARPPGEEIIEEGEQEPRSLEVGTTTSEFVSRGRPLVPIAAGAVLLLLAVHLRLLNKRVKAAPASVSGPAYTDLAPLDDDGFHDRLDRPVVQPRPVEPTRPPEPSRMQPPAAALFDYEHEQPVRPVPDEDWAEREWEDEIREVDAEIREVVVARSR